MSLLLFGRTWQGTSKNGIGDHSPGQPSSTSLPCFFIEGTQNGRLQSECDALTEAGGIGQVTTPSNNGLHQTARVGVPASRAVVEARAAGEAKCYAGVPKDQQGRS